MTDGHKHRHIRVRRDGKIQRLLQIPLRKVDFETAQKSRFVYGAHDMGSALWTLTPLSILHTLFGLTIETRDPWEYLPDAPEEIEDPRWHFSLTKEQAWCAWPCDACGIRRDEHADQGISHGFSAWDIADHKFRAQNA